MYDWHFRRARIATTKAMTMSPTSLQKARWRCGSYSWEGGHPAGRPISRVSTAPSNGEIERQTCESSTLAPSPGLTSPQPWRRWTDGADHQASRKTWASAERVSCEWKVQRGVERILLDGIWKAGRHLQWHEGRQAFVDTLKDTRTVKGNQTAWRDSRTTEGFRG